MEGQEYSLKLNKHIKNWMLNRIRFDCTCFSRNYEYTDKGVYFTQKKLKPLVFQPPHVREIAELLLEYEGIKATPNEIMSLIERLAR